MRRSRRVFVVIGSAALCVLIAWLWWAARPGSPASTSPDVSESVPSSARPAITTGAAAPAPAESPIGASAATPPAPVQPVATPWVHTFDRLAYGTRWQGPQPPELAAFRDWTARYAATPTGRERFDLEAEGVRLATARRPVMRALIERDPERALELTVPHTVRAALPAAVLELVEQRVSGTGTLAVVPVEPAAPGTDSTPAENDAVHTHSDQRFVRLDGITYTAHIFGRRHGQTTADQASLHGIVLDHQLALHASPLRVLDPGERPAGNLEARDPATGLLLAAGGDPLASQATTPALVEFAGRWWALADPGLLEKLERSLRAMETLPGPVVPPFEPGVLIEPPMAAAAPTAWTTGAKRLLVIRIDFSDVPGEPRDSYSGSNITQSFADNIMNSAVRPFYVEASYAQTSLTVTVTNKVYRMPKTAATYANAYDLFGLYEDATAAAGSDHNEANFDLVQIVFSNIGPNRIPASKFGFAGVAFLGGKQSFINGYFLFDVVAHELGHCYGLPHANLWQSYGDAIADYGSTQEYGDTYDVMGGYNGTTDKRHHFSPWFKNELGWLPDSAVTFAATSGTYRIHRFDAQSAPRTHPLALNVFRDGTRSYWLGHRRNIPGAMASSAYVQWGFYGRQQSQLLDIGTPGSDLGDAGLAVGTTLDDSTNGVTLRTVAQGGIAPSEYIDVAVTVQPPARNLVAHWGEDEAVRAPPGLRDIVAIVAGDEHGFARQRNGELVVWGENNPEGPNRFGELNIPWNAQNDVASIWAGGDSCAVIKTDGTIVVWGWEESGQNNVPDGLTNVKQVGIGGDHCLALKNDGTVVGWGSNEKGQITIPAGLTAVRSISAGRDMSLLLLEDGTVRHLGINAAQLPNNLTGVTAVAAGWGHGLALSSDGTVVAWGDNSDGQATVPAGLGNVKQIGAGHLHSVALKNDGTIVAWGSNELRQVSLPRGLPAVETIAVAENHVMGLILGTNAPFFIGVPQSQDLSWGSSAFFYTNVESVSTVTYRWQRKAAGSSAWIDLVDDAIYSGSAGSVLAVSGVTPSMNGDQFRCVATDAEGRSSASSAASLSVTVLPTYFFHQPGNLSVTSGDYAAFSAYANGTHLTLRWQRLPAGSAAWVDLVAGDTYAGVDQSGMTILRTTYAMNGDQFRCIAGNGYLADVISEPATLTVVPRPLAFSLQTADVDLPWGQNASLRIAVVGEAPFQYRWQRRVAGATTWSDLDDGEAYGGTRTAELTIADGILAWNGDQFRCIVIDALGSEVTSATVTLRVVFGAPAAATWPTSGTPTAGGGVTFSVITPADPAASYQWRYDGQPLPGATEAQLTITDLDDAAAGAYDVVFTRGDGSVFVSQPVLLQVRPAAYGNRFAAQAGFAPSFTTTGGQPAEVHAILPIGDGWIVAGTFAHVDGQPRGSIARIRRDGSLDPAMFANGAGFNGFVEALARAPDGRIYAGGSFTSFDGESRARVARLLPDGTLDSSFNVSAEATAGSNFRVYSVLPDRSGRVFIGGSFSPRTGPDSQGLIIADLSGAVLFDATFAAVDNAEVWDLALDPLTGRVVVAGALRFYSDGQTRCGIRVLADGSIDPAFVVTGFLGSTNDVSCLPDGRILMCGDYLPLAVNTWIRKVIRLLSDGSRDYSYESPDGLDGSAYTLVAQADGKAVVGGSFAYIYNTPQAPLLRLADNGSLDSSFVVDGLAPSTNGATVWDLHGNADGSILVGGSWMSFGAVAGRGLVLLECTDPAPEIAASPQPGQVVAGNAAVLRVEAIGDPAPTFQWRRNGIDIIGATSAEYQLRSAQSFDAGAYSVVVRNGGGVIETVAVALTVDEPAPSNARLTNLSTRALDLTGDKVLIPGFVIAGPGNKTLLIRAVGPTLIDFGLTGTLPNPRMTLKRFNGAGYDDLATNDDWGTNSNVAEIIARSNELGAFGLVNDSADAALLVDLAPGQYSVVTDDPAQQIGIAIVELYDADASGTTSRLINISNRGYVGVGDNIMIPGFVVSSEGPKTLLIRAIGPTLGSAPYNVSGVLADPTLAIHRQDVNAGTLEEILANDDWSTAPGAERTRAVATQVSAFALAEGSKDAAFVVTLNPGLYTVLARGKNDTEGVALVELYAVP